jgi:FkbM family methyltransferase
MRDLSRVLGFIWNHPLNRGGRMRAILRFVWWQAASRLASGPIALPFVDDARLLARRGMTGATGNYYCGLHEPAEMGFLLHVLRRGDLFVDVGANVGSYTVLAAAVVGARVVAVEPVAATFGHLQRNVAINRGAEGVRTVRCGLGARPGELAFTTDADTVNHVVASGEAGAGVMVPVTTLDDLCAGEAPALIKIDVEGYEREVVAGGSRTLRAAGLLAVLMETNGSGLRYGWRDEDLVATMRGHGFATCAYDPLARELGAAPAGSANTIFVRDAAAVIERIRTARKFRLVNGEI